MLEVAAKREGGAVPGSDCVLDPFHDVVAQQTRHGQEDDILLGVVATRLQEGCDAVHNLIIPCLQLTVIFRA